MTSRGQVLRAPTFDGRLEVHGAVRFVARGGALVGASDDGAVIASVSATLKLDREARRAEHTA